MFKAIKNIFKKDQSPYINGADYFSHYEFDGPGLEEALDWADSGKVISLAMSERPEDYGYLKDNVNSPYIKRAYGYYPFYEKHQLDLASFEENFEDCDLVGAIGIFTYQGEKDQVEKQEEVFEYFLKNALDHGKKSIIIDSNAGDSILNIMRSHQAKGHIVMTDQLDKIPDYLDLDSFIAIDPSIYVYEDHAKALENIPAENILTAIGSYKALAWAGLFEPGHIVLDQILETIGQIKGIDKARLRDQIYENYLRLGI